MTEPEEVKPVENSRNGNFMHAKCQSFSETTHIIQARIDPLR